MHRSHGPSRRHTYQFIVHSILHKMQWMDGVYLQGKAINRPTHRTEVSLSDSLKMALFLGSPYRAYRRYQGPPLPQPPPRSTSEE